MSMYPSFGIPLPTFVREVIHRSYCIPCNHVFNEEEVTGFGFERVTDGGLYFFVQLRCSLCHRDHPIAVLNRPMDLPQFAWEVSQMAGAELLCNAETRGGNGGALVLRLPANPAAPVPPSGTRSTCQDLLCTD